MDHHLPDSHTLQKKFARVELVVSDVDGVLTDDTIHLGVGPGGERIELYRFNTKDGIAALECGRNNLPLVFMTGRTSPAVKQRAADLKVECLQGVKDKVGAVEKILTERGLGWESVLFIGNDIQDLSLIRLAGIAAAPADAVDEVRQEVAFISTMRGGEGAFREIIEQVLKAKGQWSQIIRRQRTLG